MWTGGSLYFQQHGTDNEIAISKTWSPSIDTWYHVALTRSGSTWRFFVDGTQIGTDGSSSLSILDITSVLYVGTTWIGGSSSMPFKGWMD